jgi:hypothetical protein
VVIEPIPEQLSQDNRPASSQIQLCNQIEEVTPRKKPQPLLIGAFKLGGLGRNRTIDTRIFNNDLLTKPQFFSSGFSVGRKWCVRICVVVLNPAS